MSRIDAAPFLRRILFADAVISGATGLVMATGSTTLAPVLGMPEPLLRFAGWSLVPFAMIVGALSRQQDPGRSRVAAVVAANAAWVAASAAVLVLGLVVPNGLGYAFVIAQACSVAVLAEMQYAGLRRLSAAVA
jgi:hypothetical protein